MSLTYNNTAVKKITLNGDDVKHLDYNGTRTWDAYRTMTLYIDQSKPENEAFTYGDDAIDMIPGSNAWDEFFGHYPCMHKAGVEGEKLQKNDFELYEDGTAAPVTTATDGCVMIAFPCRGLNISTENDIIKISMTDNPNNNQFKYNAHTRNNERKNKFYLSSYCRENSNVSFYPVSGGLVTRSYLSEKRGALPSGYALFGYYQYVYIQCMLMLKYKTAKVQGIYNPMGYRQTGFRTTGTCNKMGMDVPLNENQSTQPIKVFGLECFFDSDPQWIDSIKWKTNGDIFICDYVDWKWEYKENRQIFTSWSSYGDTHYTEKISANSDIGFIPISSRNTRSPIWGYAGMDRNTKVDGYMLAVGEGNYYTALFSSSFGSASTDGSKGIARIMYL